MRAFAHLQAKCAARDSRPGLVYARAFLLHIQTPRSIRLGPISPATHYRHTVGIDVNKRHRLAEFVTLDDNNAAAAAKATGGVR